MRLTPPGVCANEAIGGALFTGARSLEAMHEPQVLFTVWLLGAWPVVAGLAWGSPEGPNASTCCRECPRRGWACAPGVLGLPTLLLCPWDEWLQLCTVLFCVV